MKNIIYSDYLELRHNDIINFSIIRLKANDYKLFYEFLKFLDYEEIELYNYSFSIDVIILDIRQFTLNKMNKICFDFVKNYKI